MGHHHLAPRHIVRQRLGDELPYSATVEIEKFEEDGGLLRIGAVIWLEREGQKAIVIGARGAALKAVDAETLAEREAGQTTAVVTGQLAAVLALVGERGPEIVNLPRGASVTPNHRIGGNVISINVNVPAGTNSVSADRIAVLTGQAVQRALRRNA